jgi:hypothetical protein
VSNIELRWLLTHATAAPRLQYRATAGWPQPWSEWQDVPLVLEQPSQPAPAAPTLEGALATLPLPKGWTREPDGRLRPPPGFIAEAQAGTTGHD